MNNIQAFGSSYEVPGSNGQLESSALLSLINMDDEQWLLTTAKISGRVGADIDPAYVRNVAYLRAYLEGATACINARLVLPTQLIDAEAVILLEAAKYAADTVKRLRALDEEMAMVDEF